MEGQYYYRKAEENNFVFFLYLCVYVYPTVFLSVLFCCYCDYSTLPLLNRQDTVELISLVSIAVWNCFSEIILWYARHQSEKLHWESLGTSWNANMCYLKYIIASLRKRLVLARVRSPNQKSGGVFPTTASLGFF